MELQKVLIVNQLFQSILCLDTNHKAFMEIE